MSHVAHQLYAHITWSTEKRQGLIDNDIKKHLNGIITNVCDELGYQIIAFEAVNDHVHLLVRFKQIHNLVEFIKAIKGRSSRVIPCKLNKPLSWRKSYSITTVGPKALQAAIQYIKNQKEHHLNRFKTPE